MQLKAYNQKPSTYLEICGIFKLFETGSTNKCVLSFGSPFYKTNGCFNFKGQTKYTYFTQQLTHLGSPIFFTEKTIAATHNENDTKSTCETILDIVYRFARDLYYSNLI